MQLNITTDYAIRTVLYLAIRGELTASSDISRAMNIPSHYILKVTNKLTKGGLIKCFRGVNGGFVIGKSVEDIYLYDIINIFEPTLKLNRCLEDDQYCSRFAVDYCPVRSVYSIMQKNWEKMLRSVNVASLLNPDTSQVHYENQEDFTGNLAVQLLQAKSI